MTWIWKASLAGLQVAIEMMVSKSAAFSDMHPVRPAPAPSCFGARSRTAQTPSSGCVTAARFERDLLFRKQLLYPAELRSR